MRERNKASVLARWPIRWLRLRDFFGGAPVAPPAPPEPPPDVSPGQAVSLGGALSGGPRLGLRARAAPAVHAARRCGRDLRQPALSRLPRPQVELPRDRPAGRPRDQGLPGARRRPGRARRPVPAELPLLRDLLLRGAQGRRHRGQLQSAVRRARDRAPDRRFEHLDHGHAQHQGDLSQGRPPPCRHLPENHRGRLHGRPAALARAHAVRGAAPPGDRRRADRRASRPLQDADRERRQIRAGRDRPGQGRGGAAVHRRHHRVAQGRHAHPCRAPRQYPAGRDVGDRQPARPGEGGRRAAPVPRVRHDRR